MKASNLMDRNRIKRLPVANEGRVAGLLSRADILNALMQ